MCGRETRAEIEAERPAPAQGVSQCFRCKRAFDFFNRRHHCRCCGRIFCAACSAQRCRVARLRGAGPAAPPSADADAPLVRVCGRCFSYLQRLDAANA